jgi:hypothetical protein
MPVAISGNQVTLCCFNLQSNSKFKVNIGNGNNIDDLKEAIKEKRKPRFDSLASDELRLWRVNTNKIPPEEILNDELVDTTQIIGETFNWSWSLALTRSINCMF